jgi:hypothetical protein
MRRQYLGRLAAVVAVATLLGAGQAAGHSPDPVLGGALYGQNQDLVFRWMAGEVPPARMQTPIKAAAADVNESRASRAATFRYLATGSSTVEYGQSVFCGVNGLACFSRADAPDTFAVAYREHGHRFDWGTLRWCQMLDTIANGCYDVENVGLDEFGHVLILGHHVNYADERDYLDAVVQTVSRARPESGWNAHRFGRCDVASLQVKYDMQTWESLYSTCLDLTTSLDLSASATSIRPGDPMTFTANLKVTDLDSYGRLGANPISSRTVVLQRRLPTDTAWTNVGTMSPAYGGVYTFAQSPTTPYDWRATFAKPSGEGIRGANSVAVRVTVNRCPTICPNFVIDAAVRGAWRDR